MAHKPPTPAKPMRIWRIRAKRKTLGWVVEADAESAIKAAMEEFQVDKANEKQLIAQPVGPRGRPMALTGHQRRLLKEIKQIANIAKVDYPQIAKAYAPEERTTILHLMKDKIIRGDVILKYTLIDEFLTDIICDYYFERKEPHYQRLWRTKPFQVFVHYIMDETYLLKKLSIVHAIRAVPKDVRSAITRINDVRNDLAHTFFPQQRRRYVRGKKVVYDSVHLFTTAGVKRFSDDFDLAYEYLRKRLRGPYLEV
jgi:hypothetical protein